MKRLAKQEHGYSLVEVLAAIVILSLAILPMVGMFDAGLQAARLGSNYDKARALANSELETAKANPSEIEDSSPCPIPEDSPLESCTVETEPVHVTTNSSSANFESGEGEQGDLTMTKVRVTVNWEDSEYSASGIVAE